MGQFQHTYHSLHIYTGSGIPTNFFRGGWGGYARNFFGGGTEGREKGNLGVVAP
jgi:hypothetical protein